jgi:hypothetical protein
MFKNAKRRILTRNESEANPSLIFLPYSYILKTKGKKEWKKKGRQKQKRKGVSKAHKKMTFFFL